MIVRRACVAMLVLTGCSSVGFGQPGDFPSTARPRSLVPVPLAAPLGAEYSPRQGSVAPVSRPVERTVLEVQKSHPHHIHSQLGLIAENLAAAGLMDEARHIQALQQRVSDEHYERLLAAHKKALASAVDPQISLRVRWVEVVQTPETTAALRALFVSPEEATPASGDSPMPGAISGVLSTAETSALIDHLSKQGLAKIVTEPQITLVNGRTTRYRKGYERDFPAAAKGGNVLPAVATKGDPSKEDDALDGHATRFLGTSILATAVVEEDNLIKLSLNAQLSEFDLSGVIMTVEPPAINSRRVQTEVELSEGQTLFLAGLLSHHAVTEVSRIPMLGDIPGIGRLFTSKRSRFETRQLLVVITPEIVRPMDALEAPPVPGFSVPRPRPVEAKPSAK